MLVRLRHFCEGWGDLVGLENPHQLLENTLVTLRLLHRDGFVKELSALQTIHHKSQQIHMDHPHFRCVFGDMIQEEQDMLADTQFCCWRVVKDVKRNLVSEAFAAQQSC